MTKPYKILRDKMSKKAKVLSDNYDCRLTPEMGARDLPINSPPKSGLFIGKFRPGQESNLRPAP